MDFGGYANTIKSMLKDIVVGCSLLQMNHMFRRLSYISTLVAILYICAKQIPKFEEHNYSYFYEEVTPPSFICICYPYWICLFFFLLRFLTMSLVTIDLSVLAADDTVSRLLPPKLSRLIFVPEGTRFTFTIKVSAQLL